MTVTVRKLSVIKKSETSGLPSRMNLSDKELNYKIGNSFLKTILTKKCECLSAKINLYATKNFQIFSFMRENRDIDETKVRRLKQSFKDDGYKFTIVFVNEKLEFIDGQHRFKAIEGMQLPLYFCIMPGWGMADVRVLNLNTKGWNDIDFLRSYARGGNKNYKKLRSFYERYDFHIATALDILVNLGKSRKGASLKRTFREGNLQITDKNVEMASLLADKINEIGEYHPGGETGRKFVKACAIMFRTPKYDHKRMLSQLRDYPDRLLMDAVSFETKDYLEIFMKIYNKNLGKNKVNFLDTLIRNT